MNADTIAERINWVFQKVEWLNPVYTERVVSSIHNESF